MQAKRLQFEPYARLLTMLGDQLIKNERIALVELIKNSYDADASWVKVTFEKFGQRFEVQPESKIVIEDDGVGMSRKTLETEWVRPATPIKKLDKLTRSKTKRGRVVQGEKGIGRFAILKLGKNVTLTTRQMNVRSEHTLKLNVSAYNDDFLTHRKGKGPEPVLLKDIDIYLSTARIPRAITSENITLGGTKLKRQPHGTRIEIGSLRATWSRDSIDRLYNDLLRLQSIFEDLKIDGQKHTTRDEFEVYIYQDSDYLPLGREYLERLGLLMSENAVFRITAGRYDEDRKHFAFRLNGERQRLALKDPAISGLKIFRDYYGKSGETLKERSTECGDFSFEFYVFDFSKNARGRFALDADDRKRIKEHRTYVYRDGIRVYPYGDPDDDWLQIDTYRGTVAAGGFLSNDQVVGVINITQAHNPKLIDKTNREGLLDTGNTTQDFKALIQIFLAWVRRGPYARYRKSLEDKSHISTFNENRVSKALGTLGKVIPTENKLAHKALSTVSGLYQAERQYLIQRAETTEHLAGVGLSVETASHDIMSAMNGTFALIDGLILAVGRKGTLDRDTVGRDLATLRGMLSFISTQLQDVQLLFRSTKQRRKSLRVRDSLDKVVRLFEGALSRAHVECSIVESGSPLVAKTTDAVLLQLFLNLFDNAIYWLQTKPRGGKHIRIHLDGDEGALIFSDDGPGISADDRSFIFEAFYSGKGEEGRGLGLYIARQLLDRHDYSIDLADIKRHRLLKGANFVVSFVGGARDA